ncbi:unnamed protein product [Caenorhabditis bovis]|uniref:Uncharacterized protein n=1 Tax=Caenorhabditis bovis TaxID=2654633 RepID=A0A8S1ETQ6_9PELO|nr:unnamed protein product [Caenorhabditis bovis]
MMFAFNVLVALIAVLTDIAVAPAPGAASPAKPDGTSVQSATGSALPSPNGSANPPNASMSVASNVSPISSAAISNSSSAIAAPNTNSNGPAAASPKTINSTEKAQAPIKENAPNKIERKLAVVMNDQTPSNSTLEQPKNSVSSTPKSDDEKIDDDATMTEKIRSVIETSVTSLKNAFVQVGKFIADIFSTDKSSERKTIKSIPTRTTSTKSPTTTTLVAQTNSSAPVNTPTNIKTA